MELKEMYKDFREKFPEITKKTDEYFIDLFSELDDALTYLWFESLSETINKEMKADADPEIYKAHFEYFNSQYSSGSDSIKSCIDVAFVENLFWQVPPDKAKGFWVILPNTLKDLYVQFHHKKPA